MITEAGRHTLHDQIQYNEGLKYEMWSTYVNYFEDKLGVPAEEQGLLSYFEWLDHFGLV